MNPKKIYFEPASQVENTGDLLINKVALDMVRQYGDVIINDAATPKWFIDEIAGGNDSVASSKGDGFFVSILRDSIKGRGDTYLILPPGDISRKGIKSSVGTVVRSLRLFALRLAGCRIIRLGFSIGPFDRANAIAESIQSLAYRFYGVRDSSSLAFGKSIRINNIVFFPDFSWHYVPDVTRAATPEHGSDVVLSFRSNANGTKHDPDYLRNAEEILSSFLGGAAPSTKVTMCYQVAYDKEGCRGLHDALRARHPALQFEFIDKKLSLSDCNELYSKSGVVISNRLHVLMLAAINGAKIVALTKLGHNKKIAGLFRDNNIDACIVDSLGDVDQCAEELKAAMAHGDQTQVNFRKAAEQNKAVMEKVISSIFS